MKEIIDQLNNIQYLRFIHLVEMGTDINKVSNSLGISIYDTIVFITEWNQYSKLVEIYEKEGKYIIPNINLVD